MSDLSQALTKINNLTEVIQDQNLKYYDLFVNPDSKTVSIKRIAADGTIETLNILNLAGLRALFSEQFDTRLSEAERKISKSTGYVFSHGRITGSTTININAENGGVQHVKFAIPSNSITVSFTFTSLPGTDNKFSKTELWIELNTAAFVYFPDYWRWKGTKPTTISSGIYKLIIEHIMYPATGTNLVVADLCYYS